MNSLPTWAAGVYGIVTLLAFIVVLGMCRAAGDADALAEARMRDLIAREAEDARVQARRVAGVASEVEDELERLWLAS